MKKQGISAEKGSLRWKESPRLLCLIESRDVSSGKLTRLFGQGPGKVAESGRNGIHVGTCTI